ncbi:hypothetical protein C2845_PM05G24760 [Panicum miliaceum]|uniref:Uncharacterized protein n=1 Tax=Panicum miliaceum TaxID=4540 RepID=A0A3L6SW25_PANMI|nr:hypothetical protein C2845_PM05G24760 [Panicum miliaceum]
MVTSMTSWVFDEMPRRQLAYVFSSFACFHTQRLWGSPTSLALRRTTACSRQGAQAVLLPPGPQHGGLGESITQALSGVERAEHGALCWHSADAQVVRVLHQMLVNKVMKTVIVEGQNFRYISLLGQNYTL